jgi:hypothetical protein
MYMPPKKRLHILQDKTKKIGKDLEKLNQRANEFREFLKLKPVPIIDINGNIIEVDKME